MEWLGDMNTVLCLLIIIIWESCIQSRLISSNTNYDRLFDHTTLAMQILDDNYQVHFTSKDIKDVIKCLEEESTPIEKIITHYFPLEKINEAFDMAKNGKETLKILINHE